MTEMLQRFTTEYIEAEDRIRLAGEFDEKTVVLWLMQRLLNRLIPHLCQWLDQRVGTMPLADVKQEFAQQKARVELEKQPPVRADANTQSVLIQRVDLKAVSAGMTLRFKDTDDNVVASLQLQPTPLRQWLNIVHDQYCKAQWSTAVWPAWVTESKPQGKYDRAAVLH